MAVIRHGPAPEDHYSLIPNELARSTEISLQAKGLYLYLRSHREGWEMSTERIGEALGIHRDTVSRYVRELENLGYLDRQKVFDESGRFAGIAYILSSEPLLKNTVNGKTPDAEKDRTREKAVSGDLRQHKKTNSYKKTNDLKEDYGAPTGSRPLPDNWEPTDAKREDLAKKFPNIDLDAELSKFRAYWKAKTGKQAEKKDWDRTFGNWVAKARPPRLNRQQKVERMEDWKNDYLASRQDEKTEVPF